MVTLYDSFSRHVARIFGGGRGGATEANVDQTIETKNRSLVRIILCGGLGGGGGCSTEEKVDQTMEMYFMHVFRRVRE